MKRLLALAAVLGLAVGYVLMRTSTPPATESAPVETRESVEAVAPPQLDAPESVPLDRTAPPRDIAPPERSAASARAPIVLTGRLTNASGKDFRTLRGQMRITDARGNAKMAPIDGDTYAIDGLAPGAIDIGVEAPGFRRVARAVTLDEHETEHREDFALDPAWTIAVQFMASDGRNFLDRELERQLLSGERLWAIATEDEPSGQLAPGVSRYRSKRSHWMARAGSEEKLPGDSTSDCYGILDVDGAPPIYVSAVLLDRVVATRLVPASIDKLTIEIPLDRLNAITCGVKGRVIDGSTLAPVPSAMVSLLLGSQVQQFQTDAAGAFSGDGLFPGIYTLSIVRVPEYAIDIRRIQLAPALQNDLGEIPLQPAITLRGRCIDAKGRAAQADVELSPYLPEHRFETSSSEFGVTTDADGRFAIGTCGPRVYVLRVGPSRNGVVNPPEWRGRRVVVDLTKGPVDDLVVSVHAAVDLILRPAADSVRTLPYWIFAPDGILASRGSFADSGVARERLAPGSYQLLLGEEASIVRQIPFTLGEQPMTLDVGL